MAAQNLPAEESKRFENRVLQRAHREHWTDATKIAQAAIRQETQITAGGTPKSLSSTVITGANSLVNTLAEDSKATKIDLSKTVRTAAQTFAKMRGEGVILQAQALRHVTSTASTLHGWESKEQAGNGSLTLNILTNQAAVQIA